MNFNNDEEVIDFFNRLLERLHLQENEKMKKSENEKSIVINIYKEGSQHVETQYISLSPDPSPVGRGIGKVKGAEDMPDVLCTEEAMTLWEKAQRAGYVDDNYQPLISRTQAALLADAMAVRLGIREKWKVFEGMWNRKYMRSDYNLALSQQQSLDFQDELKRWFG